MSEKPPFRILFNKQDGKQAQTQLKSGQRYFHHIFSSL